MAIVLAGCGPQRAEPDGRCVARAEEVAAWLKSVAVNEGDVTFWPVAPGRQDAPGLSLYGGTPGVVLFFHELHRTTGRDDYRVLAERGARWVASRAATDGAAMHWIVEGDDGKPAADAGLYTGTAGIGWMFLQLGGEWRRQARGAAEWLSKDARWGIVNDVVSGAAGVGLFLVRASHELREPRYLDGARAAGDWLLSEAIREKSGLRWKLSRDFARVYPNFSHGTAGVAFFLAVLYARTKDERYLRAALDGAAWLESVRPPTDAGAAWYRHEPDARELYYVGWCHGPAGTARLFRQLHRVTGDATWSSMERECARWVLNCGAPKPLPGFWNVSVCCGTAGVGEFFVDLFHTTRDDEYRARARVMAEHLDATAAPGAPGLKWVQAEHRVKPDDVRAQTGYMQGAAGIGLFFLKMSGRRFTPPDSPY